MGRSHLQPDQIESHDWISELRSRPTIRPTRWSVISSTPRSTVYDQIKDGSLPSLRLGGTIYIPTAPLLKMLGVE
jgi:hypothetical protein